jgi:hypothetical protein
MSNRQCAKTFIWGSICFCFLLANRTALADPPSEPPAKPAETAGTEKSETSASSKEREKPGAAPSKTDAPKLEAMVRLLRSVPTREKRDAFIKDIDRSGGEHPKLYHLFKNSEYGTLLNGRTAEAPRLYLTDYIFIAAFDEHHEPRPVVRNDQDLVQIEVRHDDKTERLSVDKIYCRTDSPYYCMIPVKALPKLVASAHLSQVIIKVPSAQVPNDFHCRRFRGVQAYGWDFLGLGALGLWVPVGIFATNFQRTPEGIQFSALPIGVALGSQFHVSNNFYFGISGIAMWAITSGTTTDPSGAQQETATLRSLGAGFLVDFSSIMYVTATHQWNFASGQTNPGWMMGLGLGADLLKRIARGT